MGISGLLQFLKDAAEPVNVKKYGGQTVAVDTYCWLHKGAFSCAEKLAKGEETDQYVCYCMKFVDMLLNFRVKPILVFDGRNLPSKQEVDKARRERREANLQKGRRLLREGKVSEARDCFTRCVSITPPMAHSLIKVARARGVDCVVAPYEADAQLAYLTKSGLAQAVITEDSDLLAFGCRKVILKMDKQGNGLEIDQSNLGRCRSLGNVFTEEKFRHMCILSGCDYLSSLHGIGLGKACKLLRLAKDPDILKVIRKMGQYLKMNLVVPESYVEGFIRANNTFLYQLVFDPVLKKVVPLNPYPDHLDPDSLPYAGLNLGDAVGFQMALGNLDINTLQRIDDFDPDKPPPKTGKARSRSWNDSPVSTGPSGPSVWTKGFLGSCADVPQPAAPAHPPVPSRGQQRASSLLQERRVCKELQLKRPRQDSAVEQELLQQYSSSFSPKRSRAEHPGATPIPKSQARPRNRFATLLQRRNQEEEEEGDEGQATRSRFFSQSRSSMVCQSASGQPVELSVGGAAPSSPPTQTQDSDEPEIPSVDTPSPPLPPSPRLRRFPSSDGSAPSVHPAAAPCAGLAALRRFQYKTPSDSSPPTTQPQGNSLSCPAEEAPISSSPLSSSPISSSSISSSPYTCTNHDYEPKAEDWRRVPPGAGGERPGGSMRGSVSRVQRLGPARVSGLRRRRPPSSHNENNPGVQATISSLWRNFSFSKVNTKMTSCQKDELVKDGVGAR